MSDSHKRERAEFRSMRSELLKDVIFEYPQASNTRADALAYKAMREKWHQDLKEKFYDNIRDPELTLKPDLSLTNKSTARARVYSHNGKWESRDGKECWSCCISAEKDGRGCISRVEDKERWNLSSC